MNLRARGQGLVEYGLIAALSSALTLVWLVVFGGTLGAVLLSFPRPVWEV